MTLIELLIASSLLLVVLLVTFQALETTSKSQAYQANRSDTLDEMRNVLNRMTKDLRQATSVDETLSTPSTVSFTTYINGTSTDIVYTASGTTLTRKVGTASPVTVMTHLASTNVFDYVSAGTVSGVQWVDMNLQVTPKGYPSTTLVLDSEVNLRNRTSDLTGTAP